MNRRAPDFVIIGAAKSGTTSLYRYLAQHPLVYFPSIKEPNFFAYRNRALNVRGPVSAARVRRTIYRKTITDERAYLELFAEAAPDQLAGEASPRYLYYDNAPANLATTVPQAKLVVLLRDPVRRAYSHYRMNREYGLEPCRSFAAAVAREDQRIADGFGWDWHYMRVSRYGEQIRRYLEHYPRERLFITTFERFAAAPEAVCRDVLQFLGLPSNGAFDVSIRHKAGDTTGRGPVAQWVRRPHLSTTGRLLRNILPRNIGRPVKAAMLEMLRDRPRPGEDLEESTYRALRSKLEDDIRLLVEVADLDVGNWKWRD